MGNLTAQRVKHAGPGKYEDGDGLRLVVSTTGSKKWVLRVTVAGKRREMGLGPYPMVSLAEAREQATTARRTVREGQDPIASRKGVVDEAPEIPTFTQVAARYIRVHRHGWSNIKHARQWCATLKTYARPTLGNKAINDISTEEVLAVLTPIWKKKTETAKRVQGRIENILDFAATRKWRDAPIPTRWRGHLDKLLPRPTKVTRIEHHPAMPYDEVPAFMLELKSKLMVRVRRLALVELLAVNWRQSGQWTQLRLSEGNYLVGVTNLPGCRTGVSRSGNGGPLPLGAAPFISALR